MAKIRLFYSVVQDFKGNWSVLSFGGRTRAEEKRFALSGHERCVAVETDCYRAQAIAEQYRLKGKCTMQREVTVYCVVSTSAHFINNRPQLSTPQVRALTEEAADIRGEVKDAQDSCRGCFVSVWRNGRTGDAVLLAAFDQNGELDYEAIANAADYCLSARRTARNAINDYEPAELT